jgi:hypothetical protein
MHKRKIAIPTPIALKKVVARVIPQKKPSGVYVLLYVYGDELKGYDDKVATGFVAVDNRHVPFRGRIVVTKYSTSIYVGRRTGAKS